MKKNINNSTGSSDKGFYRKFIQIPGPNPLMIAGGKDEWDECVIECADVFKDHYTYYLYYHGIPKNEKLWPQKVKMGMMSYRIGVAMADSPLGPWKKYEKNPLLDLGPKGSWEDRHIACPHIIKEEENKYYMLYSASGASGKWDIGLATADNPLGPWEKHKKNPVIRDFGYVGGVVKHNGKYYLYTEHPVGFNSPDQGPMCLAIADSPEGPWKKYSGNPVLAADEWGSWDDGGFSEAKVVYHDGMFHMFYGGTKWKKLERIGYAYSYDGLKFTKYPGNPVALTEYNAPADAFAEVHAMFEPPFIYLYHTIRYKGIYDREDIGVQIMATQTPFRLAMPVLNLESLPSQESSQLDTCPPISLANVSDLAISVECTYHAKAQKGLKIHLRGSCDRVTYDTEDLYTWEVPFKKGGKVMKTMELNPKVMFAKLIVENQDQGKPATGIKVTATIGQR